MNSYLKVAIPFIMSLYKFSSEGAKEYFKID